MNLKHDDETLQRSEVPILTDEEIEDISDQDTITDLLGPVVDGLANLAEEERLSESNLKNLGILLAPSNPTILDLKDRLEKIPGELTRLQEYKAQLQRRFYALRKNK